LILGSVAKSPLGFHFDRQQFSSILGAKFSAQIEIHNSYRYNVEWN